MTAPPARKTVRDDRLDFFRGLAMFIIFVAHVPNDGWNDWIPARFGFSSGTELFVFCSGAASAIAFGRIFVRRGLLLGTARILHRMWQVYWAHVGVFVVVVAITIAADALLPGAAYFDGQFGLLARTPGTGLLAALTLTWQPPFVDILPMYLVVLAMVPVAMALRRLSPMAPFAASALLYALVWTHGLTLPGHPATGEAWFFNPFAWQLVFFSGFAVMSGWVPLPPLGDRRWMTAAVLFLVAAVPVAFWGFTDNFRVLADLREAIFAANEKTDAHILRWLHFLALAYVVLSLVEPWRARLSTGAGAVVVMVGRQSLAAFLASLVMARIAWILLDRLGHDPATTALVNLAAFAGIVATARLVGWFKSAPWDTAAPAAAVPAPSPTPGAAMPLSTR